MNDYGNDRRYVGSNLRAKVGGVHPPPYSPVSQTVGRIRLTYELHNCLIPEGIEHAVDH